MGRAPPPEPALSLDSSITELGFASNAVTAEISLFELSIFIGFIGFVAFMNLSARRVPMAKEATLNLYRLNRVNVFKELFLGYLGAGMLEPIMAIASEDYDRTARSAILNLCQLGGLFSWLYLLTDAFDVSDTQQAYIYWDRIMKQGTAKDLPAWFKKAPTSSRGTSQEAGELRGSFTRDLSLWFMLACSFAACCGVVGHRDVIHSHAVVLLWAVLHHQTRLATAWRGTGYFHTLFSPSAALLPLEYCLNLTDQEIVGDDDGIGDLAKLRAFIKKESGVDLIIEA